MIIIKSIEFIKNLYFSGLFRNQEQIGNSTINDAYYSKITQFFCRGSGQTCDNLKCKIKMTSKTSSKISFNCDLKRSLNELKVVKKLLKVLSFIK